MTVISPDSLAPVDRLPVGTRIRFNRTLIEPACGDHPELLYARAGDTGRIAGYGTPEGYWATWDAHPAAFGIGRHEFEVVGPNDEFTRSTAAQCQPG